MADLVRRPAGAMRRARQLDRGPRTEYLAFELADSVYAAPVALVREILKPPPLTPVPRAPHAVLGIVSVRGQLVTVLDLRRRLHVAEKPETSRSRILLVEGPREETIGLYVDEVLQVHRLADGEIEVATNVLGGEIAAHIAGIARPGSVVAFAAAGPGASKRDHDAEAARAAQEAPVIVLLDLRAVLASW